MIQFKSTKRIFDSKKVESHSAIIPTYMQPGSLNESERIVYEAVKNRFLAQFMPIAVAEDTVLHSSLPSGKMTVLLPLLEKKYLTRW